MRDEFSHQNLYPGPVERSMRCAEQQPKFCRRLGNNVQERLAIRVIHRDRFLSDIVSEFIESFTLILLVGLDRLLEPFVDVFCGLHSIVHDERC
jgi:hypothetical protein